MYMVLLTVIHCQRDIVDNCSPARLGITTFWMKRGADGQNTQQSFWAEQSYRN